MNLNVLQLFGAESTKVIKKQLYTNNMSCKQKKDCSSKRNSLFSKPSIKKAIVPVFIVLFALLSVLFQIVVNSLGPRFVFEWKDITLFRPFIPFSL